MKKWMVFAVAAMVAGSAMAGADWLDSFAFTWDSVSSGDIYYDLNGATADPEFHGADLGTFELTDQLFLNSQINGWADGTDYYNYMSLYWRIGGSGAFTEQQDSSLESTGGNNWRAFTPGIDLIAEVGAAGTYAVQIYIERSTSWDGGGPYITRYDLDGDTGGAAADNFFEADFTVNAVPEPATMSLLGLGALAMVLRRKMRK